jgi:hypothetical protein
VYFTAKRKFGLINAKGLKQENRVNRHKITYLQQLILKAISPQGIHCNNLLIRGYFRLIYYRLALKAN